MISTPKTEGKTQRRRTAARRTAADSLLTAVVAGPSGEIFELEGYAAAGMSGTRLVPLTRGRTRPMPHGSELMYLPDRRPVLFNRAAGRMETLSENPYAPGEALYPVAAFNSPGYLVTQVSAYRENPGAGWLPLFSYGAVGWAAGGFRTAVVQVDRERRQDLRLMPSGRVRAGVLDMRRRLPDNRLARHLETCALTYGCPAGKNFFLGRCEAPLPTSRSCNARCLGCISRQPDERIPCSQNRIAFTPAAEEIRQVALTHIQRVRRAVVSFGQGCEGDPLLAADVIAPAVRQIRRRTSRGTVNLNTNASRPETVARLLEAGVDSMRVSLNSVRPECYQAYFRPRDYRFADVEAAIDGALERRAFVSLNYLNSPGFTDTPEELEALCDFLERHPVRLIQWRNLNIDPLRYWQAMDSAASHGPGVGMDTVLRRLRRRFPELMFGYFNPPREKWARHAGRPRRKAAP